MLVGHFHELLERLHRLFEFLRKLGMFLVLPRIPQRPETRLQRTEPVLHIPIKPLQFLGKAPDLLGVYDGLLHKGKLYPREGEFKQKAKVGYVRVDQSATAKPEICLKSARLRDTKTAPFSMAMATIRRSFVPRRRY